MGRSRSLFMIFVVVLRGKELVVLPRGGLMQCPWSRSSRARLVFVSGSEERQARMRVFGRCLVPWAGLGGTRSAGRSRVARGGTGPDLGRPGCGRVRDEPSLVFAVANGPGPRTRADHLDLFEQRALIPMQTDAPDLTVGIEGDDMDLPGSAERST